jgi:hypothetical protein
MLITGNVTGDQFKQFVPRQSRSEFPLTDMPLNVQAEIVARIRADPQKWDALLNGQVFLVDIGGTRVWIEARMIPTMDLIGSAPWIGRPATRAQGSAVPNGLGRPGESWIPGRAGGQPANHGAVGGRGSGGSAAVQSGLGGTTAGGFGERGGGGSAAVQSGLGGTTAGGFGSAGQGQGQGQGQGNPRAEVHKRLRVMMDSLTPDEQRDVQTLVDEGFPMVMVGQVYTACDKNLVETRALLQEMR